MKHSKLILAVALLTAVAVAPLFAADRNQSEQTRGVLDKQRSIADALRDKLPSDPVELQKKLDSLKADLSAEQMRHDAANADLQKQLQAANDAGIKRKAKNVQASIDKENEGYTTKTADLNKQIKAVQTKLDATKAPAK